MGDEISVRQWQELYRAGAFAANDFTAKELAGWDDFYDPLNNKGLQNLAKLVMSIRHPFILDHYHVYFLHHTPGVGPMYGCAYFDLLSEEDSKKMFFISVDSPHERKKWVLETRRYGEYGPEYECGDIRRMSRYIHNMASELEQDIQPSFIAEKQAVLLYVLFYGEPRGICVYREGHHRYSYTSIQDGCTRNVMVISDPKDAPPGFNIQKAENIKGLLVYCPENEGKAMPDYFETTKQTHKRKGPER